MTGPPGETAEQRDARLYAAALADPDLDDDTAGPPPAQAAGFTALLAGVAAERAEAEARWQRQAAAQPRKRVARAAKLPPAIPAPPVASPLPPARPPATSLDERIILVGQTVERIIATASQRSDQIAAFHDLTKLLEVLPALEKQVAAARNALVLAIRDEGELSFARLGRRLNISRGRADQLVRAAQGLPRRNQPRKKT